MSRHRSPSGRHPHPRPVSAAIPGAGPRPAPSTSPLRNGLQAAAVTGTALAVVMPALTVGTGSAAAPAVDAADAALRLAAQRQVAEPERGVHVGSTTTDDRGPVRLVSVLPVEQDDEPLPPQAGAADLLKAVGLLDLARQAQERQARASCDAPLGGLGGVKPWVRSAAIFLSCLYGEPRLIGVASRAASYSDHPFGLAVDFMVTGARGDALAACALRNKAALGIDYVIYKQRINYGDGWAPMEDRGGVTANHFDHVHVSFARGGGAGKPLTDVCG